MTRWARSKNVHKHEKQPEDPTPWETFVAQREDSNISSKIFHKCNSKKSSKNSIRETTHHKLPYENNLPLSKKSKVSNVKIFNSNIVSTDFEKETEPSHKKKSKLKSKLGLKKKAKLNSANVDFSFAINSDENNAVTHEKSVNIMINSETLLTANSKTFEKRKSKHMKKQFLIETDHNSESILKNEQCNINTSNNKDIKEYKAVKKQKRLKKSKDLNKVQNKEILNNENCNNKELSDKEQDKIGKVVSQESLVSEMPNNEVNRNKKDNKLKKKEARLNRLRKIREKNGIILLPEKIENKLYRLKKALRKKGTPAEQIKQIIRKERRKYELSHRKIVGKTSQVCFRCRKSGHQVSDCPVLQEDVEQPMQICFKCGSTEHKVRECHLKTSEFPYAKCFVCGTQGHLSRNCPQNKLGIYPKGGKCKHCSSINHLIKDCPQLSNKKDLPEITVEQIDSMGSVDADLHVINKVATSKKSKIVKF